MLAVGGSLAWASTSQTTFGVTIEAIQNQMAGGPRTPSPYGELGSLWNLIPNPQTEEDKMRGLGGGITWAFDNNLCDALLPAFKEDIIFYPSMLDCDSIKASVARAFNGWAANNRHFTFVDVTEECRKLGMNFWSVDHTGPTPSAYTVGDDEFHGGCPLAEIWVTVLGRRDDAGEVGDIAVATARSFSRIVEDFYFTNGRRNQLADGGARNFIETYAGMLSIGVNGTVSGSNLCWYLDSYFCVRFHNFKRQLNSPATARQLLIAVCWACAVCVFLYWVYIHLPAWQACCCGFVEEGKRAADRDGDGQLSVSERVFVYFEVITDYNPFYFAVVWTMVFAPPMVLYFIMLPCWDCADFEAAMLHEIGHFVGLGHPDNIPSNLHSQAAQYNPDVDGKNTYNSYLAAGNRPGALVCDWLWNYTEHGVPREAAEVEIGKGEYKIRNSVMEAFTQHNPKPCLLWDDVEALATMYPDCSAAALSSLTCHKVNHNLGYFRTGVYVVFPLFVILIGIVSFSSLMHWYQKDELGVARKNQAKLEQTVQVLEASLSQRGRDFPEIEISSTSAMP